MEKKAAPNRALLCVFGAILGAILSILITLLKYYFFKNSSSSIVSYG
jgi:LPS O-antigen subunit length determinant protein (WzzB/FepE family)